MRRLVAAVVLSVFCAPAAFSTDEVIERILLTKSLSLEEPIETVSLETHSHLEFRPYPLSDEGEPRKWFVSFLSLANADKEIKGTFFHNYLKGPSYSVEGDISMLQDVHSLRPLRGVKEYISCEAGYLDLLHEKDHYTLEARELKRCKKVIDWE